MNPAIPALACLLSLASAPAAAQEPAPAGKLAFKMLQGVFEGPETGVAGRTRATCRFEPVLKGTWIRFHYRSHDGKTPIYSFLEMLRVFPDGSVEAWHFDDAGNLMAAKGRVDAEGMTLKSFGPEGDLLWMLRDDWVADYHRMTVRSRPDADHDLQVVLQGFYRPHPEAPPAPPGPAAWERVRATAYAPWLGTFEGREKTDMGISRGRIESGPILDGSWILTRYCSTAEGGREVYAGLGLIQCNSSGEYILHWFDTTGDQQRIDGAIDSQGAVAHVHSPAGEVLERHTDRFIPGGYRFLIETRTSKDAAWKPFLSADYLRVD
ncbi:MAG: hypothetical protein ACE5H3_04350 [Planctomycetota bacterium]